MLRLATHLQQPVLRLNRNDLVPNQLQDPVNNRLKALQNFLIRERHVTLLNTGFGEFSLNANVHRPLLPVVSEVRLDPVLEVHDALGVHLARSLGAIRQFHLPDLGPENVGKIAIERGRTARIS